MSKDMKNSLNFWGTTASIKMKQCHQDMLFDKLEKLDILNIYIYITKEMITWYTISLICIRAVVLKLLHQVPPQKIFGFPSTTIMTNIKMQCKWLPTAPGVCSRCVCVCVFTAVCVCTLDGLNAEHKFWVCHVTFTFSSTIHSKKKK